MNNLKGIIRNVEVASIGGTCIITFVIENEQASLVARTISEFEQCTETTMTEEGQTRPTKQFATDNDNGCAGAIRPVTKKQQQLAEFIARREVAEIDAVLSAMRRGDYDQVGKWKEEANRKTPRETAFPKSRYTL